MTRSELVSALAARQNQLSVGDVDLAVRLVLDTIAEALASGRRLEIRGFGSFTLHYRPPRLARNPRSGAVVPVAAKHVPHFKSGKKLRERVLAGAAAERRSRPRTAGGKQA